MRFLTRVTYLLAAALSLSATAASALAQSTAVSSPEASVPVSDGGERLSKDITRSDTTDIVAALRANAIPLRHVEAGNGFADLQPLKQVWKDVRVIGLGEITHGTREFFQVKHRLLEFLVREMGFTAIAIEASYSNTQPINDFVLHGKGDRASALTGQGWIVWDTEELAALLDWMRAYNATVPDLNKVRFHGMDVYWNEVGQRQVLAFLRRAAPDRLLAADSLFQLIAREEAKRPVQDTAALATARPALQSLAAYLGERKDALIARSSASEFESAVQHLEVMRRALTPNARANAMADNLRFVIDHERPSTKFVLWAYDGHLASNDTVTRTIGRAMRESYGDRYYAVATTFNQGSYQTRVILPNQPAGDLKAVVAPPAPSGALPWYLARTGVGNLFLDLRALSGDPVLQHWIGTPLVTQGFGWAHHDIVKSYRALNFRALFDGIIFIERTTPSRPTPNARENVAKRLRI